MTVAGESVPGQSGGGPQGARDNERATPIGRRVLLAMGALGVAGIVVGSQVQRAVGKVIGSGLGGFLPGGNRFRLYTITGSFPDISRRRYRLEVSGLVDRPLVLSVADLEAMPSTRLVRDFQCVTGWRVPDVHWEGVRLSDVIDAAGVKPSAVALAFDSYDGADTESLTLGQARLSDVIVAYKMLGGPITSEHGGPVRLYVAPMYGYKSLKWLKTIRLTDHVEPGFWEQNGYAVDGWVGASNGRTDAPIR
jgi:DMSO/TMAO reductase YedYZ molybdopterin-dependent catalytic subunit